jgi:prenyltransferase beta subunit
MRETYVTRRVLLVTGLALVVSGSVITSIVRGGVNSAVEYLKNKNDNAWVTMALAVAGENPSADYLKPATGATAIQIEAPILAITSVGKDPRVFPNENLVAKLKSFYDGNQIGDSASLNDDIFGILALIASGEPVADGVIQGARNFLISNQKSDGGWGWSVGGSSSVDMTAMAVMALQSAGEPASSQAIQEASEYLKEAQNENGGFPSEPGGNSNTSSTAWAFSAMTKLGENWVKDNKTPADFLNSIQAESGYYPNTEGGGETGFAKIETAYAVIALMGKFYPTNVITPIAPATVGYRIEGSNELVCDGEVEASDALELVEIVANICGFDYTIEQLSFGPYLKRIGGDEAEGFIGWLYRVNYELPDVGAQDYVLVEDDEVLWYYGDFEWPPTRITLNKNEFASGETVEIFIESKKESGWQKLADAKVFVGSLTYATDENGKVSITLPDGAYKIFAEPEGYIRSEKVLITVGDKAEAAISLTATLGGGSGSGQGGGSGGSSGLISFLLNVNSLDFGTIEAGSVYSKDLEIKNDGQTNIYVESIVSGDDLFRNYLTVGSLPWRQFKTTINQTETKNVGIGLNVPSAYNGSGSKSGNLVFWAIQNQ